MDHLCWTPIKNKMNCESIMMMSPIANTPVRDNNVRKRSSFQSSTSNFSILPNHKTPPSGLTKFIARNPFEADLTNKLHISVMSPTVFTKVSSSSNKSSPGFTWSIDELALIHPAKIDEFPIQQMHCSDPEIEKTAQEAISRFFSENQIIPSPFDVKRNVNEKKVMLMTPTRVYQDESISHDSTKSNKETKDCWTQTVLTLPPVLPAEVEEALKPYFNFTQDQNQNCENEDANSSNSSLRRKLFSENHNASHNESSDSIIISPIKSNSPFMHNLSPPQSGMFFHGTPLKNCSQIIQRTYGTPLTHSRDSSPCNVSPIGNPVSNMSCQSIKSRGKSVARLDFTRDMSIEISSEEEKVEMKTSPVRNNICKTLFSDEIKCASIKNVSRSDSDEDEKYCDVTQMAVSSESCVRFKYEEKENCPSNNFKNEKSKFLEMHKTNFSESYTMQQSKMLSGNCMQQTTFNSAQDTGYQTYSSSNMTSVMDSYSTSIKQKLHWDEKIPQIDEEVQLVDWKGNMKNMISSTPSKYNSCFHNF